MPPLPSASAVSASRASKSSSESPAELLSSASASLVTWALALISFRLTTTSTMGLTLSKAYAAVFGFSRPTRILLLGLDAAGKTSVLYKLKLGELVVSANSLGAATLSAQFLWCTLL